MKKLPFDLEKAKAGAKLITRDGRPVRILCYDAKSDNNHKIVALVINKETDFVARYNNLGYIIDSTEEHELDLFIEKDISFRPYANAKELTKELIKYGCSLIKTKEFEIYANIVSVFNDCVLVFDKSGMREINYYNLLNGFVWYDGNPCGIEED